MVVVVQVGLLAEDLDEVAQGLAELLVEPVDHLVEPSVFSHLDGVLGLGRDPRHPQPEPRAPGLSPLPPLPFPPRRFHVHDAALLQVRADVRRRALNLLGEQHAGAHEPGEGLEQGLVVEQALGEAGVEEGVVDLQHRVHRLRLPEPRHHRVPARLEDLHHHVVDKVLEEMEHPLAQRVGLLERLGDVQLLHRLLLEPGLIQLALDVLAVEQVAEDELVLREALHANDQAEGPPHLVLECEGVEALERRRGGRGRVPRRLGVGVPLGGARARPAGCAVDRVELLHEGVALEEAGEVVLVRVVLRGGDADGELQEGLQLPRDDPVHGLAELLLRDGHEVDEEVALVQQEVALDRAEAVDQLLLLEQQVQHQPARVGVRGVYHLPVRLSVP
mmetsp:Transcript_19483/g.47582  ORF Transcript_19483/g.47582 Transcript_19483/m.47582 type:complete len:389 (+) Transcript_19483:214-1380(+)